MAKITAPPPLCSRCGRNPAIISMPKPGGHTVHRCMVCIKWELNNPTDRKKEDNALKRLGLA